jgi:hypothetical protein
MNHITVNNNGFSNIIIRNLLFSGILWTLDTETPEKNSTLKDHWFGDIITDNTA